MIIRMISVVDGNMESTEIEIDGKVYGEDVKSVNFSHDCTKPRGQRVNVHIVSMGGEEWDSDSGEPIPQMHNPDRHFDTVNKSVKKYFEVREAMNDAPCPVVN